MARIDASWLDRGREKQLCRSVEENLRALFSNGRMISNRSVQADIMLSHLEYQNLPDAISWLTKAFGWEEQYR